MNNRIRRSTTRRGSVLVVFVFMLVALVGVLAFAVDLGYLLNARAELQKSADAAALAGCWELISPDAPTGDSGVVSAAISSSRTTAVQFAALNSVCTTGPSVDANVANVSSGDIVVGYLSDFTDKTSPLSLLDPDSFNAVQVRVRKSTAQNGQVPNFFGRVFGLNGTNLEATATAAFINDVKGFRTPSDGGNLGILPYALDAGTWNSRNTDGTDDWSYDPETGEVTAGADGVKEVNLFPQGTGSPGNRGTIDIGSSNNSTADIARQIVDGVSPSDLDYHGGELKLNSSGQLALNGDTGISAGVKNELASIIGQPRVMPIFSSVTGPGNNANYTITEFAGVRIMEVKLTGNMSSKRVMIQPANLVMRGAIAGDSGTSAYIYAPVHVVR